MKIGQHLQKRMLFQTQCRKKWKKNFTKYDCS